MKIVFIFLPVILAPLAAQAQPDAGLAPAGSQPSPETVPPAEPAPPPAEAAAPPADPPPSSERGPIVEMPEEDPMPPSGGPGRGEDVDMMRGLQEERFARADSTSIGGYGELHYNLVFPEAAGADSEATIDLHRLVFFFAHNFSEEIRFYSEVEIEHAFIAGGEDSGEVGVEQAFVDWRLLGDDLGLRAGVILVPMGIINQWHEPPIFNGVERPSVDRVIIPTTWREAGIGVFGEPAEGLRYEAYLMSGLDPSGFSAGSGLRGGRQQVLEASTDGPAVAARIEYEPILGLVGGISGYFNESGPNADLGTNCMPDPMTGEPVCEDFDGSVRVVGISADARLRLAGLEARAVAAYFSIGDTEPLQSGGIDVASGLFGWYLEAGYDVLTLVQSSHQLVPFVRFEQYDTTFSHSDPTVEGTGAVTDVVFGATYRPIPQLAFKTDLILRNPEPADAGDTIFDLGVGWMF
jgi:hypothetical protein